MPMGSYFACCPHSMPPSYRHKIPQLTWSLYIGITVPLGIIVSCVTGTLTVAWDWVKVLQMQTGREWVRRFSPLGWGGLFLSESRPVIERVIKWENKVRRRTFPFIAQILAAAAEAETNLGSNDNIGHPPARPDKSSLGGLLYRVIFFTGPQHKSSKYRKVDLG